MISMMNDMPAARRRVTRSLLAMLGIPAAIAAQQPATTPSRARQSEPFVGCWAQQPVSETAPLICVLPSEHDGAVEWLTVVGNAVVARERIDPSGRSQSFVENDCRGAQTTVASRRGNALLTTASFACADGEPQTTSTILTLKSASELSRVEGRQTATFRAVRMLTFTSAPPPPIFASRLALATSELERIALRAAAARPVTASDIIDVSAVVDHTVVEAWLADRGQPVRYGMRELRMLSASKVAPDVIDMMIAVSDTAAFRRRGGSYRPTGSSVPGAEPWLSSTAMAFGTGMTALGYSPNALRGRGTQGTGGWNGARGWRDLRGGTPADGWIYGERSMTVVPSPARGERAPGSVSPGLGYGQSAWSRSGFTASPRPDGSTGSGGGTSGSAAGSAGAGSGRTAVARP